MRAPRGAYGKASPKPSTLGERIRAIRMAWKWSQERLGQALNTDQRAVSAWERGRWEPAAAALGAMAQIFGLDEATLRSGRGFRIPAPPVQFGSARIAEAHARNLVRLPETTSERGKVLLVDRSTGRGHQIQTRELTEAVRKAQAAGNRIWVVIDGMAAETE